MLKIIISILLLCSCSKIEELSPVPTYDSNKFQVHIQSIRAASVVTINGKSHIIDNMDKHFVDVFEVDTLHTLSITKLSGHKVTAAIHYKNTIRNIGEIKYSIALNYKN